MSRGRLHHIRRDAKNLLVRVLGRLAGPSGSIPLDEIDWAGIRSVLLIRPNFRMGNLLITTTALPILRANFPKARIEMLVPRNFSGLLDNHPDLDRVHTFTRGVLLNPFRLWRLMRRIREENFDLVIDGTMTGSAALLTRWAGGKIRIGAGTETRQFAYTTMVPEPPRRLWRVEAMRQYYASMSLTVPEDVCMNIALSDAERERATERWQHMGWSDETWVTGVFLGARGQKRWTVAGWAEVINTLWRERAEDEGLVVFHGSEEMDMVEKLEPLIPSEVPLSFSPGIRNFAALVAKCRQFVTTDTGPMHLACALGVPVVSLFARKAWPRFAPQREFDIPVYNPKKPTAQEVIEAHRKQRAMLRGE